jgi:hypothetical protein
VNNRLPPKVGLKGYFETQNIPKVRTTAIKPFLFSYDLRKEKALWRRLLNALRHR